MKTLFLALILTLCAYADNINQTLGYAPDYATAAASAKAADKPLMVMVVATECDWCRKMEIETLSDPQVSAAVNTKLTVTVINKDTDKSEFLDAHPAPQTPMLYFVDAVNDELIFENLGYIKKETFLEMLDDIVTDYHEDEDEDDE